MGFFFRSRPVISIIGELKPGSTKKIDLFSNENICILPTDGVTKKKWFVVCCSYFEIMYYLCQSFPIHFFLIVSIQGVKACFMLAGISIGSTSAGITFCSVNLNIMQTLDKVENLVTIIFT